MRFKKVVAAALALLALTACSKTEKWVDYTFDDSDWDVKFSIEYPEGWRLTEQKGYAGDENRDASPSSGIQLELPGEEKGTITVAAMLIVPMDFGEDGEDFITDSGLAGTRHDYSNSEGVILQYQFGTEIPQYFISVNMSETLYENSRADIEKVLKSLQVLES